MCVLKERSFDELYDAVGSHLYGEQADKKASELLHGIQPFFTQKMFNMGGGKKNKQRGDPGHQNS